MFLILLKSAFNFFLFIAISLIKVNTNSSLKSVGFMYFKIFGNSIKSLEFFLLNILSKIIKLSGFAFLMTSLRLNISLILFIFIFFIIILKLSVFQ